jgi:hypothetical protein
MRKKILLSALLVGLSCNLPTAAKSVALNDLKDFSIDRVKPADNGKAFDPNHWAYKTLKNVTDKYGVLIGKPEENFDGTKPISRNEAAIILVNLMGKVEDQNTKLNEGDKAKIEILQQELSGEINKLSGRVEAVEKSVAELKGSVSNIEESSKKSWKNAYGEDFKITGGLQAGYTAMPVKGADGYSPNFGLPYSEVAISGKLHEHLNYTAQLVPTRNFSDTTFNGLLREAYVSTDILPNHKVYIGQITRPVGREATLSPLNIDFVDYSQSSRKLISNNTANYDPHNQDAGVMVSGDWNPVSYSVGTFNGSGNNSFDSNRRTSIAGQATIKPFYKNPALGSLELGSSLLAQNTNYRENLVGYHTSYTYKKFNLKGEYLNKTGFVNSGQKARGWVLDTKYNLTDKITLLVRYDNFDPNIKALEDGSVEYVAGINYLFKDNLGLLVNFVNVDNQVGRDSHRIGFLTQVMF